MANGVDKDKLVQTLKAMNKEYGNGNVYTLDGKYANMNIPRWSTGIEDLDEIVGGGIPYGRIIEIFGPESAGKTTLAYHLMAQHDYAVDIPIEGTFDAGRAKVLGNKKGQLFIKRAKYGEEALEAVMTFADLKVPCVVIDSVPHMVTKKEFENPDMEKEARIGATARMLSMQLPKIVNRCELTNTTLIFINQVRDEINQMPFGATTHTPGGRALRHACSIRIEVRRLSDIKIPNKNPKNSAKDEVIGIVMKVKVVKSKVCNPRGECLLALMFDRGFVPYSDVKDIRAEMMAANRKRGSSKKVVDLDDEDEDDE